MGHFGCFKVIKNQATTSELNDEKKVPKKLLTNYSAQQSSRRVKLEKNCLNFGILFLSKNINFYTLKMSFFATFFSYLIN